MGKYPQTIKLKLMFLSFALLYLSIFTFTSFGSFATLKSANEPIDSSNSSNILRCSTSRGYFSVRIFPDLCPNSAKQLYALEKIGFFSQSVAFWRVNQWITQFGADQSPTSRKKRNLTDPYSSVRSTFRNDPHPVCQKFGLINASACKQSETDVIKASRRDNPWKRGSLAVIGSTALIIVISGNSQVGIAGHDCPVGQVVGDGMERVFDNLYSEYGNMIDTKTGPDQRDIFREGMEFIKREYPLVDILNNCSFC